MLALEFVEEGDPRKPDAAIAQRVIDNCRANGLLVIKCGVHRNTVRLLAPLNTSIIDAEQALDILRGAIEASRQA
jgi:4-aminobutyrate aminotransferase/(S)-3-amino-2-methylpropionate transaminase